MGLTGPWLSDSLRGIHHGGVYRHGVQGTVLASVVRRHRQERSDETDVDDRERDAAPRVIRAHISHLRSRWELTKGLHRLGPESLTPLLPSSPEGVSQNTRSAPATPWAAHASTHDATCNSTVCVHFFSLLRGPILTERMQVCTRGAPPKDRPGGCGRWFGDYDTSAVKATDGRAGTSAATTISSRFCVAEGASSTSRHLRWTC